MSVIEEQQELAASARETVLAKLQETLGAKMKKHEEAAVSLVAVVDIAIGVVVVVVVMADRSSQTATYNTKVLNIDENASFKWACFRARMMA